MSILSMIIIKATDYWVHYSNLKLKLVKMIKIMFITRLTILNVWILLNFLVYKLLVNLCAILNKKQVIKNGLVVQLLLLLVLQLYLLLILIGYYKMLLPLQLLILPLHLLILQLQLLILHLQLILLPLHLLLVLNLKTQ